MTAAFGLLIASLSCWKFVLGLLQNSQIVQRRRHIRQIRLRIGLSQAAVYPQGLLIGSLSRWKFILGLLQIRQAVQRRRHIRQIGLRISLSQAPAYL